MSSSLSLVEANLEKKSEVWKLVWPLEGQTLVLEIWREGSGLRLVCRPAT